MGSNEMDKSSKDTKESKESKTPTPQEQSSPVPTGTVNPDWPGFQAYSPVPPHGYIASNPQAHPYMWGVQHHLMPPYGTPPHPYVTMYPHGGMYAHPSMPPGSYPFSPFPMPSPNGIVEPSANTHGNTEVENNNNNKPSEVKEKLPIKRSKGSLGSLNMIMGKDNEVGKTSGASANGAYSKSGAESGSENSSDGSDANSHNESQMNSGGRQDSAQSSQNGSGAHVSQNGRGPSMAVVPIPGSNVVGPATNLNIGMDYWTAGTPAMPAIHGKVASSTPVQGAAINARDNFQPQLWDERELKRQKRKQSNRESARRSRLRKQAECDELGQRAELLTEENVSLKAELTRLRNEQDQLLAENVTLKEKLAEATGQEIKDMGQEENAQSG